MSEINKIIGANIRRYRKMKKLTQKELGDLIGVRDNTVSYYESGRNAPEQNMIFKIARVLDVKVDDLFPDETHNKEDALKLAEILGASDLKKEDKEVLNELIEKASSMSEDTRKELIKNIRFTIKYFDSE